MNTPFSLNGKTVLITGASSGIGKATSIECAKLGASCILTGRNEKTLLETSKLCNPSDQIVSIQCDLSISDQIERLVEESPILDGLVLNAGINNPRLIQFASQKDFDEIFEINCFVPVLLVKYLLKNKKIRKGASIVFTSSISGFTNISIGNGIYGASKSAMTTLMKYLALELSPQSIRCNSILPGRIETPLLKKNSLDKETLDKDIAKYPLKRYGKPEEVAYAIIYFLSDASKWVTGSSLIIDGGRSLI